MASEMDVERQIASYRQVRGMGPVAELARIAREAIHERDQARAEVERLTAELAAERERSRVFARGLAAALDVMDGDCGMWRIVVSEQGVTVMSGDNDLARYLPSGDLVAEERVSAVNAALTLGWPELACMLARGDDDAPSQTAPVHKSAAWQRKPVTHEWAWVHAPSGETLYVIEALQRGYTVAPFVSGLGCPAKRPIEPSERGEP